MKIISDFHDYYDRIGFSLGEWPIFKRTTSKIDRELDFTKHGVKSNPNFIKLKANNYGEKTKFIGYIDTDIYGCFVFCNNIFPFKFKLVKPAEKHYLKKYFRSYWTRDGLNEFVKYIKKAAEQNDNSK